MSSNVPDALRMPWHIAMNTPYQDVWCCIATSNLTTSVSFPSEAAVIALIGLGYFLTLLVSSSLGFTLDGTVKVLDFGLARIVENASVNSNEAYAMSGETGSLRYMAPGRL